MYTIIFAEQIVCFARGLFYI